MKKDKKEYQDTEALREALEQLRGKKFMLDCGHKLTLNQFLGNNVIIYNGKRLKIICTDCGY